MSKTLEQALEIYESVASSRDLKVRAKGVFQALDGLMGEENIAKIATDEDEYLRSRFSAGSIGTKMSQAKYYELIRKLPLVDGENAYQESNKDGAKVLKHFFFKYCGLTAQEWDERNASNRVYNRLQENIEVDASEQIQKAYRLLQSQNPWEIGAGLIAVSGRRPHEIVARAKFTPIDGEEYLVQFKGQGKKRGEEPVFPISILVPVDVFLKAFRYFKGNPIIKAVNIQAKSEAPDDIPEQNRIVDKLSNKQLNRVVKREFKEILPPRSESGVELSEENEADISNTSLKSAYLAIATKRDCEGSPARQMLFASKLAGHFIDVDPNDTERMKRIDRELQHFVTTLGYMSYYIKGDVPFFKAPKQVSTGKLPQTRITQENKAQLDEWTRLWGMTNQANAMSRVFELARQALTAPTLQPTETQQETESMDSTAVKQLEEKLENYQQQTEKKFNQLLQLLQNQHIQQQPTEVITTEDIKQVDNQPKQAKQITRDWESVSKAELFGEGEKKPAKGTGATEERIRRAIEAIMAWNDQFEHDKNSERKWSINNRAVRDLAGVNGIAVKEWLESHHRLVSDHNAKHGITDVYHNRCHKTEGLNPDGSKQDSGDLIREEVYPLIK
jgi:hypothetical protein